MDGIMWVILAAAVLPVILAFTSAMTTVGLQKKFADLGNLQGRDKADILRVVGPPNSVSTVGDGVELLQWQASGYHIALRFKDGLCEGVTHEHSA